MCGIAGWIGALPNGEMNAQYLAGALRHRGPDASGVRQWHDATLVHTRLSIIDLSPAGAQPMPNEDGTIWTVFNGEIYNHREIRRDLESRGHIFKGRSDTEILPHLYEEKGLGFVEQLRGMFALAIYDSRTGTLLLTRDRFGIKPLFFAPNTKQLIFASEIRALLGLPGIDTRPDRQAISDFAALFYIPAPTTFYRGIRALQPGEVLEARMADGRVCWKVRTYHRWSIAPDEGMTLGHAAERVEELLTTAVRRQIESDVPLGSLLSGGIDSSLVSVAAQSALVGGLRTFNVKFAEERFDETWAAVAVAESIRSHHSTLDMNDERGTWEGVTDLLLHAGQPFADASLFAANAVCRMMRRHVTVALSGDGGDEGFGGYDIYWNIARIARWQTLPASLWRQVSRSMVPFARVGLIRDQLPGRVRGLAGADDTLIIEDQFCWIGPEEHSQLCVDTNLLPVRRLFEPQWEHRLPTGVSRVEKLSAHATEANVRLMLASDFLFKVDTASMKEGLEIRVPMLDEELFGFALSLPHRLKVDGRMCKKVLRTLAMRQLPPSVAAKPKWGFAIPVDSWVDADFKARLKNALLDNITPLSEYFRPDVYRPVIKAFCEGGVCPHIDRQGLYHRAIMLLSVHLALTRTN